MNAARSRFDALLLDLDGTLVDSLQDLTDALNALLAERGLSGVDRAAAGAMVGDGVRKLVERALRARGGDPAAADALVPRFLALYEPIAARHTRPFPGVVDTLSALAEAGFALAVVTNKPVRATRIVLDRLGLDPLVATVIGGDSVAARKPDPAPLHAALTALGVPPGRAVMVGDNHHDIEAARAAGTAAVAVSYGYAHRPPHELGADALIDAFSALPAALTALAEAHQHPVEAPGAR
ncbi:phosphoglycolate phosphatase [Methylobacterium sp. NEAU 140]|uniref:phosphoglycolate phosphatase n=1 Tax=Methylobacterium sp. NEAU 140 TaxID=3064945 RepID=UPI0027330E20|nr:phosphoglycolate phosphatase [Methylobacterium sp. NEAU 140]MDP4026056.1 phosphoglycolate phosphatase [Methylobacterium sp. NEAU 140]